MGQMKPGGRDWNFQDSHQVFVGNIPPSIVESDLKVFPPSRFQNFSIIKSYRFCGLPMAVQSLRYKYENPIGIR